MSWSNFKIKKSIAKFRMSVEIFITKDIFYLFTVPMFRNTINRPINLKGSVSPRTATHTGRIGYFNLDIQHLITPH